MLITVPLMIWSARTVIDSQAWRSDTSIPAPIAARTPTKSAGVHPKIAPRFDARHRVADDDAPP